MLSHSCISEVIYIYGIREFAFDCRHVVSQVKLPPIIKLIDHLGALPSKILHRNHLPCKGFIGTKQSPIALTGQSDDVRAANEAVESALSYDWIGE